MLDEMAAEAARMAEALVKDRKEQLSQLDYIIWPMGRNDEVYIHNARKLWATWDHYPIFARIEEEPQVNVFQKRNKKWAGWKPTTEEQLLLFKREVRLHRKILRMRPRKYYTERVHRRKNK